ncbi:solute carrier family 23 member 1-like [Tachypleus tridentatus]|uniref:solute carrier family 23 member 1-like n=1 Tax=Tachypleus tridentatus TaxID=6853 RepID=UPI003FD13B74
MAEDNRAFQLSEEPYLQEKKTNEEEIKETYCSGERSRKVSVVELPPPTSGITTDVVYRVDETPRWYLCILLGIQQYLTMFGATVAYPYLISPKFCIGENDPARGYITSTTFFVSGLGTLIQSIFGTRLPIIQGSSFTFLVPTFAILGLPQWECPSEEAIIAARSPGVSKSLPVTEEELREVWQSRLREIQGAIIVASFFEVAIGFTGIIGFLLQWITPLAIVPTVALIGLSLFEEAAFSASKNWGIAILTIILLALFSQYLRNIDIICCSYSKDKGWKKKGFPFFKLFPVLLTIIIAWVFCAILTVSGALGPTDPARTDLRLQALYSSPWFRFPYPGQWGLPTVSTGAVFGILAGILASVVESVGDYYACARLAGAPHPPTSAINRGIFAEGISCILSGIWGSGGGLTSYSENIGAIGVTKVASRRVVQCGAVAMLLFGVLGKFGAFFNTIPEPVIGGIFCVMFAIVTGVGLSNLQCIDLHSSRNIFILGLSLFMGLTIPKWVKAHPDAVDVGNDIATQLIKILLNTSMFVGGFIGFLLDNTIPGTAEERGLNSWRNERPESNTCDVEGSSYTTYDFPFGMKFIRKYKVFSYIPISPTYDENIVVGKMKSVIKLKGLLPQKKSTKYNINT